MSPGRNFRLPPPATPPCLRQAGSSESGNFTENQSVTIRSKQPVQRSDLPNRSVQPGMPGTSLGQCDQAKSLTTYGVSEFRTVSHSPSSQIHQAAPNQLESAKNGLEPEVDKFLEILKQINVEDFNVNSKTILELCNFLKGILPNNWGYVNEKQKQSFLETIARFYNHFCDKDTENWNNFVNEVLNIFKRFNVDKNVYVDFLAKIDKSYFAQDHLKVDWLSNIINEMDLSKNNNAENLAKKVVDCGGVDNKKIDVIETNLADIDKIIKVHAEDAIDLDDQYMEGYLKVIVQEIKEARNSARTSEEFAKAIEDTFNNKKYTLYSENYEKGKFCKLWYEIEEHLNIYDLERKFFENELDTGKQINLKNLSKFYFSNQLCNERNVENVAKSLSNFYTKMDVASTSEIQNNNKKIFVKLASDLLSNPSFRDSKNYGNLLTNLTNVLFTIKEKRDVSSLLAVMNNDDIIDSLIKINDRNIHKIKKSFFKKFKELDFVTRRLFVGKELLKMDNTGQTESSNTDFERKFKELNNEIERGKHKKWYKFFRR